MLLNKKIWLAALAVILTIAFFTYQSTAQSIENDKLNNHLSNSQSDWNNSSVPQKYWLTEDQISKINNIRTEYDDKIQPQIEELYNLRDEAYEYGNNDNVEYKKMREYRNQINQLEEQIYDMRLEARDKIRGTLVKGQRPYYRDYAFNNWWTWDMDNWCRWDMDRYMMDDSYYRSGTNHHSGRCCW